MRILDIDNDKAIKNIMILLTTEEASELRDDLDGMLQKGIINDHAHVNDTEYEHEITIAIYDYGKTESFFNERTKKLVLTDE